jgi:hypothetical protein
MTALDLLYHAPIIIGLAGTVMYLAGVAWLNFRDWRHERRVAKRQASIRKRSRNW